jgi:asparagine synthase (glutamine-hydrolysing)
MCGISGIITRELNRIEPTILQQMCQTLTHRGPDDEGYYIDAGIGLAMRRLSVIDLTTGQQPISNETGSVWLIFNGEIYNYCQLRADLLQRGHVFETKSDSEVIVHAYETYGDRFLDYLNGMFAIAIWDTDRHRLLLARDRLGIKPLYYWATNNQIIFGSELKALLAHPEVPRQIDPTALDHLLTLEYIPSPRTIIKGISKLQPGHYLVWQDGRYQITPYWHIPADFNAPRKETDYIEQLEELIDDAVRLQLVSDVPIGAFLSGGIDSSTIVAAMDQATSEKVRTFSIGFEDDTYNELPYARQVAAHFGTIHEEAVLNPDIVDMAEKLIGHLDEPLADFSIFPTYLVSQLARQQVTVALSGDGGDELFGGYDTYIAQKFDRLYGRLPTSMRHQLLPNLFNRLPPQPAKKGLINKAKRFIEGGMLPAQLQHTRWMIFLNEAEKNDLYRPGLRECVNGDSAAMLLRHFQETTSRDWLAQQQYVDIKTYLADNILTKVDRMSMAVSLETRVPLLDHRIVEFALNLPPHLKIHRGQTKVILRRAMAGRLPKAILNKPKQGFSIPLKHWLRGSLRPMMIDLLTPDRIRKREYFDPRTVQRWVTEHLEGQANHSHHLWPLMIFELWQQQTLD